MRRIDDEIHRRRGWNAKAAAEGRKPPYRVKPPLLIEIFWPSTSESPALHEVIDLNTWYGRCRFNAFHVN